MVFDAVTAEELTKIAADAAAALGEHFEAVQILVSNSDGEGTHSVFRGVGNFYARLGMCNEFLEKDRNEMLASKVAEALEDDE